MERAQLHIVVWEGGRGNVEHPLTLNGSPVPTPDWGGRHDLLYTVIEIDPRALRADNEVAVFSDTEHHGIEVCLPGPALIVRTRGK